MPRHIRVRAVFNKGRRGVPLSKLPKVISEFEEFLHDLAGDLHLPNPDSWQGLNFRDGSLDFVAEHNGMVSDAVYAEFNEAAKNVIDNRSDDRVANLTRRQYAKIASPIDPDETVYIGVQKPDAGQDGLDPDKDFELHELTRQQAEKIELSIPSHVPSIGSVQGYVHSVFLEGDPHFMLRELSSEHLVRCVYKEQKYPSIAEALQHRRAVLHVFGPMIVDTLSRRIEQIEVDKIWVAPQVTKDFLDHFIGCASDLDIGRKQIDEARRRGEGN